MRFIGFEIENFKGVTKAELDFSKIPHANVFTLVGLNESGKTTLLEAINSFSPDEEGVEALYKDIFKQVHPQDLVPKTKKGIFSGAITVRARVLLDSSDKHKIEEFCRTKLKAEIDLSKLSDTLEIAREHHFTNSTFEETRVVWDLDLILRKRGSKSRFKDGSDSNEWQAVVEFIREKLPRLSYFPTFLFGFPEKIYLSNAPKDSKDAAVNAYYVQIIQDILDSIGGDLNITTHILEKVERTAQPNGIWNWFGFIKTDEKQQIDHIMLLIANKVSETVINRWDEVFEVPLQNKSIDIEWAVEPAGSDSTQRAVYLQFRIKDGQGQYNLAERSLGFRWFFLLPLVYSIPSFSKKQFDGLPF